jgi:hypothetical protein
MEADTVSGTTQLTAGEELIALLRKFESCSVRFCVFINLLNDYSE